MGTIKTRVKADRRIDGRLRPYFDRLEARVALSGSSFDTMMGSNTSSQQTSTTLSSNLSVLSTSPGSSANLSSSPSDLFITFDRPIDDFSLSNFDFDLVHIAADGSTTPLGLGEASYSEALDPNDPTGSRIDLKLTKPLLPGHYGLLLDASSQIQGLDGSSLASTNSNTFLSDFTITSPKSSLANAVDLGTIGSTDTLYSGVLNLATDPGQVQYYKITVAPGHHWRLGIDIARSDGSTLATTLSLFKSNGQLISTNSVGLPDDPSDPYLFAGLNPGTYYVGVSSQKNIPDASGTYDPSQTVIGTSQTGGAYQIDLVADHADQATKVLGVQVDHADPLSTDPTGLTLQFAGPITVAGLQNPADPGLTLVDLNGQSWPITFVKYDANLGQLSLVFNQPLPSGTYRLQVANTEGLVDLAGDHPVGSGLYATTLASFSFTQQGAIAGDAGAILPDIAASGLNTTVDVNPGQSTTEQFVIVEPGVYILGGANGSSNLNSSVLDAQGNNISSGLRVSDSGTIDLSLQAGVYQIALTNTGSTGVTVELAIRRQETQLSSLLDAGVAQGPALNLRLITPQANFGQITYASTTGLNSQPSPVAPEDGGSGGSSPSGQSSSLTVSVGQSTPSGPSVTGSQLFGTVPYGRPLPLSNQISFVGPSGPSGSVAVASASEGLPGGLTVVPVEIDGGSRREPNAPPLDPEIKAGEPAVVRGAITTESGLLARSPESRRADDRTLEQADWIGQIVSNAMGWIETVSFDQAKNMAEKSQANVPVALNSAGTPEVEEEPRLEAASFSSPVGVGVVLATIAYRYRRGLLAFVKVRPRPATQRKFKPTLAGPHRRSKHPVRVH